MNTHIRSLYANIQVYPNTRDSVTHRTCTKPSLNDYADITRRARCLVICLGLPVFSYFMYARGKGSDEAVRQRRLV